MKSYPAVRLQEHVSVISKNHKSANDSLNNGAVLRQKLDELIAVRAGFVCIKD
jgi:hypothetical protein